MFERRPAVRADPQARRAVRRSAPAGHRRPGGRAAARRPEGRRDREDDAVPDHPGRRAARRAPAPAAHGRAHARAAARGLATTEMDVAALRDQPRRRPDDIAFHNEIIGDKHDHPRRFLSRRTLLLAAARRRPVPLAVRAQSGTVRSSCPMPPAPASTPSRAPRSLRSARRSSAPVVVDNQPGAGGIVGLQALARSAPDGNTLSSCRTTS